MSTVWVTGGVGLFAAVWSGVIAMYGHRLSRDRLRREMTSQAAQLEQAQRHFERQQETLARNWTTDQKRFADDRADTERRYREQRENDDHRWRAQMRDQTHRWQQETLSLDKQWHREKALELMNIAIDRACSLDSISRSIGLNQLAALLSSSFVRQEDAPMLEAVASPLLPPDIIREAARSRADGIIRVRHPISGRLR